MSIDIKEYEGFKPKNVAKKPKASKKDKPKK